MTQLLVATVMWLLVVSLLILRRRRTDHSITYASLAIAISMTLNVDEVYFTFDRMLGTTNITTIIGDGLLMIGLSFLGRGVMKAGEYRPRLARIAVGRPALAVALAAVIVSFVFIDRGSTTDAFMRDVGDQIAACTYSLTVFTYCAIVVGAMHVLAISQWRATRGLLRIPSILLTYGSLCGLALCVTVWVMDIAHVTGNFAILEAAIPFYGPLMLSAFVLLCAGFFAQPLTRLLRRRFHQLRTDVLIAQLEPVWRNANAVRPGLSNRQTTTDYLDDPDARLHRQVVEIRDAMIDPRVKFTLTRCQLALIERAERHLLGTAPPIRTVKEPA
ncbi:hypothetical protein GCM10010910_09520 [Microbacterium nanhaiense]|uniref:DUF6545 domain-containing protein n=1 Tax=Microbacterium nanhaiense TaxID=1301026 RepID=A0ABQ2MYD0_9MICO|nr:DUF6545 domain-containing protein [Microbacterium nanhaiense]GGO61520.1 hypothetical protein GCM10010910_09520 [Microbacterium nanhaiense]